MPDPGYTSGSKTFAPIEAGGISSKFYDIILRTSQRWCVFKRFHIPASADLAVVLMPVLEKIQRLVFGILHRRYLTTRSATAVTVSKAVILTSTCAASRAL